MLICPECRAETEDAEEYCPECGGNLI